MEDDPELSANPGDGKYLLYIRICPYFGPRLQIGFVTRPLHKGVNECIALLATVEPSIVNRSRLGIDTLALATRRYCFVVVRNYDRYRRVTKGWQRLLETEPPAGRPVILES